MLLWIVVVFLGCLACGNYLLERSVLYPPFIFSMVWLLVLSVDAAGFMEINELHVKVLCVIGGGAFLFSLGGLIALLIPRLLIKTRIKLLPKFSGPSHQWFQYFLVICSFIGMLLVLKGTLAAGAGGTGATFLARARNGTGQGAEQSALVGYAPELVIFSTIWISMERRDWLFWVQTAIGFATAVFTTSRGPILGLLCGIVTVSMIQRGRVSLAAALRFVRIPALSFVTMFVLLVYTTKDVSGIEGGITGVVIYSLVTYLVGPTAALDQVFENPSRYMDQPIHTLKFPLQLLAKTHLISFTPAPLLDEWVTVPFPANVYTGYKFFFTDFGFAGVIILVFLIGLGHTLIYRKATSGSQLGLFWFSTLMGTLVMFFFDDGYTALGMQLTTLMFGCLYLTMRSIPLMGSPNRLKRPLAT